MSDSPNSIHRVADLLGYFRMELALALDQEKVRVGHETEAYLVHMLEGFARLDARSAEELGFHKPAAICMAEAMSSSGEGRIEAWRRLGDASLFSCGFFDSHLRRTPVSPEYYRSMGRTAYQNLENLMAFKQPGGVFARIFQELAQKFDHLVVVLRWVGQRPERENPSEALLERLRRGDPVDVQDLVRAGLLPSFRGARA